MSQICEEFGCRPSEALEELMDGPPGLVLDVMELRGYARTKHAIDEAKSKTDVPDSPMVDQVFLVMAEILRRRNAERGR